MHKFTFPELIIQCNDTIKVNSGSEKKREKMKEYKQRNDE